MANFIEADVIQKIATEAEWLTQTRIPYQGQIMLVGDSSGKVTNIKVGDGVNPFADLNYMFDSIQQNVQYVPITSNALPTPVADPAWGFVTGGTYTFGGVDAFTVPTGHWGIANYISGVWSLVDMGELPIQDLSGLAEKSELQYRGTFDSIALALAAVPLAQRKLGDTVGIKEDGSVVEYWWNTVTDDGGLVKKTVDTSKVSYTFKIGILSELGQFDANFDGKTSDFIFCEGVGEVRVVAGNITRYATFSTISFYDKDKVHLSSIKQLVKDFTAPVPDNAVYVRGCSLDYNLEIYLIGILGINALPKYDTENLKFTPVPGFIQKNGEIYAGVGVNTGQFLVKGASKVTVEFRPFVDPDVALVIAFYDADELFILGHTSASTRQSFDVPEKAVYAICSGASLLSIDITKGAYSNAYETVNDVMATYFVPPTIVIRKSSGASVYLPAIASNRGEVLRNTRVTSDKVCAGDNALIAESDSTIEFYFNSKSIGTSAITIIDPASVSLATQRFVLPIGDSLTANNGGAWTNEFSRLLSGVGNPAGSVDGVFAPLDLPVQVIGTIGEGVVKNEGRGSWKTSDYLTQSGILYGATNAFWNPATSEFDINYYLSQNGFYTAGVSPTGANLDIFIFTGWNDGITPKQDLQSLITKIKSKLTDATIILIGQQSPPFDVFLRRDHNKYRKIVGTLNLNDITKHELSQENSNVLHFPIKHLFNPKNCYNLRTDKYNHRVADTYQTCADHVHPNTLGYGMIADIVAWQYLNYLKSI